MIGKVVSDSIKRAIFASLPTPVRVQGRSYFRNCLLDVQDRMTGKVDPDIPPHRLNISGGGPFRLYGRNTVALCRKYAGLQHDQPVIDLGCGIGRTALALTEFLSPSTRYLGFDVIKFAVDWCVQNISRSHGNFEFVHSDVQNRVYNPRGTVTPECYRFPSEANAFRFAMANSLFTHLGPPAAAHYICEAARVLRPGGRFLSSWFVLDSATQAATAAVQRFPHPLGDCRYASLHAPEQAVAFQRAWIEETLRKADFILEGIHYGDWSGVSNPIESMQDIVVARRA